MDRSPVSARFFALAAACAASQTAAGAPLAQDLAPLAPSASTRWVDLDRDGLVDVLHLDPAGHVLALVNEGDGRFREATTELGLGGLEGAFDAVFGDFDSDGHPDVLLLATEGRSKLLRAVRGSAFVDVGRASSLDLGAAVRAARWLDVDSDTLPDLLLTVGETQTLHRNLGDGVFEPLELKLPAEAAPGAVVAGPTGVGSTAQPTGAGASAAPARPGNTSSRATGPSNVVALPPALSAAGVAVCASGVQDATLAGNCISASSTPLIGSLYPIGDDWFIDAATGNVGLGTITPTEALDVDGAVRIRTGGLEFPDGSVQSTAAPMGADDLWDVQGSDMTFVGGRLGIGTDAPGPRLDVVGDTRIGRGQTQSGLTRQFTLGGARSIGGTAYASLAFSNYDNDSSTEYVGARIRSFNSGLDETGDLDFMTRDANGLGIRMKIATSGAVGIGTTVPTQLLDVDGVIRAREGIELPDGTMLTTNPLGGVQYTSLGPGAFHPASTSNIVQNSWTNGIWSETTNRAFILASLNLPQGARILEVTAHVYDTEPEDLRIQVLRKDLQANSSTIIGTSFNVVTSAGYVTASGVFDHSVDNSLGSYAIGIRPASGANWPGTSDLALMSVVVTWVQE